MGLMLKKICCAVRYNIIGYIEDTVSRFPEKTAILEGEKRISFRELKLNAMIVACFIIGKGICNSPVAVFLPKGISAVISFLSASYSGNFYVPLDVKSPLARIESIMNVLKPGIVITDRKNIDALSQLNVGPVVTIEELLEEGDVDYVGVSRLMERVIDTDPLYVIFTSGSTGTPKGVVVSHRSVIDYIDWAVGTFNITDDEVIGNQAPFYFDNSVLDIYLMYATGATLVIVPESLYIFPARLADFLNEYKVSFVFWVPFVLINMANFEILENKPLKYIKKVLFAGDVMPNKHLNYWRRYMPWCLFANLYGPTEITVDCTYYIVDRYFDDSEALPIGYPCRNSDVIILNAENKRAEKGETGELCVRGSSLALGYYGEWEKTREAFVQNPLNVFYPEKIYRTGDMVYVNEFGEIIFVGRKDFQIKHNGYRIELGEIENAAFATRLLNNACAVYDFSKKRIVLFYENDMDVNLSQLRIVMQKFIPKYMVPGEFMRLDKMPVNANGKTDRLRLSAEVNG